MQPPMESIQQNARMPDAAASDRRKEPRYAAEVQDARIGWWRNQEFVTSEATLQDISSGGAALVVDPDLQAAPEMWFCVASGGGAVWVPGRVAALSSTDEGIQRVCLEFSHACPYDVFKVAAWGSPTAPSKRPVPDAQGSADAAVLATTVSSTAYTPSWEQPAAGPSQATRAEDGAVEGLQGEPASSRGRPGSAAERRPAIVIALGWLVPATLCLSMAVAIICLTYVILSDPALLDPLLVSLRGE